MRQIHSKPPLILTFLLDLGIAQSVSVQDSSFILCDWGLSSGSESLRHGPCGVVCLCRGRKRQGGVETQWPTALITDVLEVAFGFLASGFGLFSFRVKGDREGDGGKVVVTTPLVALHTQGAAHWLVALLVQLL